MIADLGGATEGVLKENIQQGTLALHPTKFLDASWRIELTDERLDWDAPVLWFAWKGGERRSPVGPLDRADLYPGGGYLVQAARQCWYCVGRRIVT